MEQKGEIMPIKHTRKYLTIMAVSFMALGVYGKSPALAKAADGWEWPGVALGAKIGTLGVGGEMTVGVNQNMNLRGGGSWAAFSVNRKIEDVDYDLDLNLTAFPLLVDVHPFGNNFRISGGVIFQNRAKAELKATPNKDVTIGDHKYSPDVIGTLSGSIESARRIAPYIGLGFGNAVEPYTAWSFSFDLGVALQTYNVDLTADGPGMSHPAFAEDIRKEEEKIQDDADSLKIYPVLAFGVAYHF